MFGWNGNRRLKKGGMFEWNGNRRFRWVTKMAMTVTILARTDDDDGTFRCSWKWKVK
jgi:hypothetical protein